MESTPQAGPMSASPLDFIIALGSNYGLSSILGCIIILLYSREKYDQPTYEHTAIGDLAPLSPTLLASGSRYRKGLLIYLSLMLAVYAALCILGPGLVGAMGEKAVEPDKLAKSFALWPVSAATLLVGIGVASDVSVFGTLEAKFRRLAHEAAFIPMAVGVLSERLTKLDIKKWKEKAGKDIPASIHEVLARREPDELAAAQDSEAIWVRANVLFHALQHLKGSDYDLVKSLDKNRRALAILAAKYTSIERSRHAASAGQATNDKLTDNEIAAFMDGSSIMLAAVLLQAGTDPNRIDEIVPGVVFFDVSTTPGSLELIALGMAALLLAASLPWLILHTFRDAIFFRGMPWSGSAPIINGLIVNAAILYACTFVVGILAREHHVIRGQWRETPGYYLRLAVTVGAITAVCAALFTSTFQERSVTALLVYLYFNFFVSAAAAFFLAWHYREVARSKAWREAIFSRSVLVHMGVACGLTAYLLISSSPLLYDHPWRTAALMVGPSCFAALMMAFFFSVAVRTGRWLQLDNQIDSGDVQGMAADNQVEKMPDSLAKLKDAYRDWLITPQQNLAGQTPWEVRRYPQLRERLGSFSVSNESRAPS